MTTEEDGEEKQELSKTIIKNYSERLLWIKKAKEHSIKDEIPKAVECYNRYLSSLAAYKQAEVENISPNLFNKESDLSELLLISQVYWDLAKAYDRNTNLHRESQNCLDKFVAFSVGYKYQYLNAELLRKFIKKKPGISTKIF